MTTQLSGRVKTAIEGLTRGNIERFELAENVRAHLVGWVFRPDVAIHRIDILIGDSCWIAGYELQDRADVAAAYVPSLGTIPHLTRCGIDLHADLPRAIVSTRDLLLKIVPYSSKGERFVPWLGFYQDYHHELNWIPQPPAFLQDRVGGSSQFLQSGTQLASLVMSAISSFKPGFLSDETLDWGCGCGRVVAQLRKFAAPGKLYGCDIDRVAIEWDRTHLGGVCFDCIDPYPPTGYADKMFGAIYGISVMTHLDEDTQLLWLTELERIARPGAILLLSVIGEQLRRKNMPAALSETFRANGFASFIPGYSTLLTEFSHPGYYKEAYHTLDYIEKTWGQYFEVLKYIETGHQDIVILRAS